MNETHIQWTDYSSNPLRYRDAADKTVWACVQASPGCLHCYAETTAKRFGRGSEFTAPNMAGLTPYLDEKEMHTLLTSTNLAGKRVFLGDMTDLFGEWVPSDLVCRLFEVLFQRSDVTFQLLTKRADRMQSLVSLNLPDLARIAPWIWLGVSVEDQRRADERIPLLLRTPAAVRFISAEPLLEAVDLTRIDYTATARKELAAVGITEEIKGFRFPEYGPGFKVNLDAMTGSITDNVVGAFPNVRPSLDLVIVGGESGPGARPCDVAWVQSIVEQCKAAGTSVFCKQLGSKPRITWGPERYVWPRFKDPKGADVDEWDQWVSTAALRVREMPAAVKSREASDG